MDWTGRFTIRGVAFCRHPLNHISDYINNGLISIQFFENSAAAEKLHTELEILLAIKFRIGSCNISSFGARGTYIIENITYQISGKF